MFIHPVIYFETSFLFLKLNNYTNEQILGNPWQGLAKVIYDCTKTFKLSV